MLNRFASGVVCLFAIANNVMQALHQPDLLGGLFHSLLLHFVENAALLRQVLGLSGECDNECDQSRYRRKHQAQRIGRHGPIKENLCDGRSFIVPSKERQNSIPRHGRGGFDSQPCRLCFVGYDIEQLHGQSPFLPRGCNNESCRIGCDCHCECDDCALVLQGKSD